jgi:4-amino-4-deoxy-L-arabinose transferase-like glycosyltransferase
MKRWVSVVCLCSIVVLAFAVRVYHLSSVPPSPYLDEVSNGYNAYSLLKTGRDEYGKRLPLMLQAYNDFRPALFEYFAMPFIALFGLTVFAIRLPSVVLEVGAVACMFFLMKELLRNKGSTLPGHHTTCIALAAAFLFAITPWSIYSSRISDEINMSLSFFVFSLTAFVYGMNRIRGKKGIAVFLLSVILFVIDFYAYHGIKLFLPFFFFGLAILYFREFWHNKKLTIVALFLGGILLLPLYFAFTAPGSSVRLGAVNTVSGDPVIIAQSSARLLRDQLQGDRLGKIFDNRRVLTSLEFLTNAVRNFDPSWLFFATGGKTYKVPDFGPLYLFEFPLLLAGFYFLSRTRAMQNNVKWVIVLSILLSVIPAGLNNESPHLNRTNTMLPGLIILSSLGLYQCILFTNRLKSVLVRSIGYAAITLVITVSFVWFLHAYFVEFPYQTAAFYQYGAIEAFQYAQSEQNKYDKIVVSNSDIFLEGYMYYLFATKYDPKTYQAGGGTHTAFFTDTHLIGKFDFRDPNGVPSSVSPADVGKPILFITNRGELSQQTILRYELHDMKTIVLPDGSPVIIFSEGKIK